MRETVFELIRFGLSFLFGIAISVQLAGIESTRKNRIIIGLMCLVFLLAQFACHVLFGLSMMSKLYPLIIHLPLVIILALYFKRPWLIAIVSVLSAYLCLQAPKWIEMLSKILFNNRLAEIISYIAAVFLFYYFLKRYVAVSIRRLIEKSKKICVFFGVMPLFFYLFNYIFTIYTDLLYSNTEIAVEFIPSFISVFYFVFITLYYAETQKQASLQRETDFARNIISSGQIHYQKMNEQYDALRIMKHDYKFHLNTALELLQNGDLKKSREYLNGLQTQLEGKELQKYCDNHVINALVNDYYRRCRELNIQFNVSITFIGDYTIPNYEMCIVLGNLLENAVEACQKISDNRQIHLVIKPQGDQLGIMVRNTYDGNVVFEGDKIVSTKKNDNTGIGLESIRAVIDRYGEMFHIKYDDQWFNVYLLWKSSGVCKVENT